MESPWWFIAGLVAAGCGGWCCLSGRSTRLGAVLLVVAWLLIGFPAVPVVLRIEPTSVGRATFAGWYLLGFAVLANAAIGPTSPGAWRAAVLTHAVWMALLGSASMSSARSMAGEAGRAPWLIATGAWGLALLELLLLGLAWGLARRRVSSDSATSVLAQAAEPWLMMSGAGIAVWCVMGATPWQVVGAQPRSNDGEHFVNGVATPEKLIRGRWTDSAAINAAPLTLLRRHWPLAVVAAGLLGLAGVVGSHHVARFERVVIV